MWKPKTQPTVLVATSPSEGNEVQPSMQGEASPERSSASQAEGEVTSAIKASFGVEIVQTFHQVVVAKTSLQVEAQGFLAKGNEDVGMELVDHIVALVE